jgi:hypothetical protein
LTLTRGEKRIPLVVRDAAVNLLELRAGLVFSPDGTNWVVKVGDSVTVRKTNYVVMDIDIKAVNVVLSRPDSGDTFVAGVNGVVRRSAEPKRSEQEIVAPEAREGELAP